jgi:hypothetical protein
MRIETTDLVGVNEMAERSGASPNTINRWRQLHPDFPTPVITIGRTPVWSMKHIERWLKATGRTGEATAKQ